MLSNDTLFNDDRAFMNADIDMFIYGKNKDDKDAVLGQFLALYSDSRKEYFVSMINIYVEMSGRDGIIFERKIQLVLSDATEPMEVIGGFDLSHVQVVYDGETIQAMPAFGYFAMYGETALISEYVRMSRFKKAIYKHLIPVQDVFSYSFSDEQSKNKRYAKIPLRFVDGRIVHNGKIMTKSNGKAIVMDQLSLGAFLLEHQYVSFIAGSYFHRRVVELTLDMNIDTLNELDIMYKIPSDLISNIQHVNARTGTRMMGNIHMDDGNSLRIYLDKRPTHNISRKTIKFDDDSNKAIIYANYAGAFYVHAYVIPSGSASEEE
jgi:hypothetical protein